MRTELLLNAAEGDSRPYGDEAVDRSRDRPLRKRRTYFAGRLSDHGLRSYLESQGVKSTNWTIKSLLNKAMSSLYRFWSVGVRAHAQGFSLGVQTLRQLLHPEGAEGKALATPMLVIPKSRHRDWPSMEWRGG